MSKLKDCMKFQSQENVWVVLVSASSRVPYSYTKLYPDDHNVSQSSASYTTVFHFGRRLSPLGRSNSISRQSAETEMRGTLDTETMAVVQTERKTYRAERWRNVSRNKELCLKVCSMPVSP